MTDRTIITSQRGVIFVWQAIVAVFIITIAAVGLVTSMYQAHHMLNQQYRRMKVLDALQNEMEFQKMRCFASAVQPSMPAFLPPAVIDKGQRGNPTKWIYGYFEPRGQIIAAQETADCVVKAWIIKLHMEWEEPDGSIQHESLRTAVSHML
jgi:hypothetical protein